MLGQLAHHPGHPALAGTPVMAHQPPSEIAIKPCQRLLPAHSFKEPFRSLLLHIVTIVQTDDVQRGHPQTAVFPAQAVIPVKEVGNTVFNAQEKPVEVLPHTLLEQALPHGALLPEPELGIRPDLPQL